MHNLFFREIEKTMTERKVLLEEKNYEYSVEYVFYRTKWKKTCSSDWFKACCQVEVAYVSVGNSKNNNTTNWQHKYLFGWF